MFVAGVLVAASVLLSGCGSLGEATPETYPPSGVDELVIPTPRPDPEDFVADVTNPYLPLTPGTVWTYAVSGSAEVARLVIRVEGRRELVAGVSCVVVRRSETSADGRAVSESEQLFAQDRRGNVWLFGEQPIAGSPGRSWRAGVDGAEAGLAMPATPRVGDGWVRARAPGVTEDRVSVVSTEQTDSGEITVPAGTFGNLVVTEDVSEPVDSRVEESTVRRSYAVGTGLVVETALEGGTEQASLVSITPGA